MEPKRIKGKGKRPRLRLIRCDSCHKISFGTVKIVAAPEDVPPFKVDAVAAEEDTFLALSAEPKAFENNEHPIRMMTKVFELRPEPPGKILVKGRNPLQFLEMENRLAILYGLRTWRTVIYLQLRQILKQISKFLMLAVENHIVLVKLPK